MLFSTHLVILVIEMEGLLFFIVWLNANGRFTTCSIPVMGTS